MKPTKTQKAKLNKLLHEICRKRDGDKCLRCFNTERLQLSHIYPKGKCRGMEFMAQNVKLLCVGCHLYFWHKHPVAAKEWLDTVMPKQRLDYLKLCSNSYMGGQDPKLLILELEQELLALS